MAARASASFLLAPVLAWAAAAGVPRVEIADPRAYGYQVGDLAERRVSIHLPAGWRLDPASLPRAGVRGRAVELRSLAQEEHGEGDGRRIDLVLRYQVLAAPAEPHVYEIAPWRARVEGGGRSEELRVEAAPLVVAPLVPAEAPARRGLEAMQPDREPAEVDTAALRWRLALWAALAAAVALWLAFFHFGGRWLSVRRRPFAHAWLALRRLPPQPPAAEWRAALRRLHEALNRSAGFVVFEAGVARFVAARPRFAECEPEVRHFLALSQAEFFGAGASEPAGASWLKDLARRLRDLERGGP